MTAIVALNYECSYPASSTVIEIGAAAQGFRSLNLTIMYWYCKQVEPVQVASTSTLNGLRATRDESLVKMFNRFTSVSKVIGKLERVYSTFAESVILDIR